MNKINRIVPCLFLIILPGMEEALADSTITQRVLQVEHVEIVSTKTFAEVKAALDRDLPQLDPAIAAALTKGDEQLDPAIAAALTKGDEQLAKDLEHGSDLFIFLKRDHGALLQ